MDQFLARRLIDKHAFSYGTRLEAYYHGHGLAGRGTAFVPAGFVVQRAYVTSAGEAIIIGMPGDDGGLTEGPVRLEAANILAVDGMKPARYARLFQLTETGGDIQPPRRRGRRRKADRVGIAEHPNHPNQQGEWEPAANPSDEARLPASDGPAILPFRSDPPWRVLP